MAQKPSIPKGTRDFGPAEMAGRNYIFDTIRSVFRTYGYAPIETPSMENLSTLMGKYGEEGDKLLFRILNSGEAFNGIDFTEYEVEPSESDNPEKGPFYNCRALTNRVCEKGLRYDLTVRSPAPERALVPVQEVSDSAGMARRPSAERALPRVLPV